MLSSRIQCVEVTSEGENFDARVKLRRLGPWTMRGEREKKKPELLTGGSASSPTKPALSFSLASVIRCHAQIG